MERPTRDELPGGCAGVSGCWLYGIGAIVLLFLVAILMPVGNPARPAARRTACRSNLHQIGAALAQYADDYDDRLPPRVSSIHGTPCTLPALLASYLNSSGSTGGGIIWHCHSDQKDQDSFDGTPGDWSVSYGYNWLGLCPNGRPLRQKEISNPAGTLAFVDTDTYLATPLALVGRCGGSPPAYRHEGIANVLWADGHAHSLTRRELDATDATAPGQAGINAFPLWRAR